MELLDSGRGLAFKLRRDHGSTRVEVKSIGRDADWAAFVIGHFAADASMTAEQFNDACATWSNNVDDAALRQLRVNAGAYPLIRTAWDGDRYRVSVTVPTIGAASGVVRVAEKAAGLAAPDLIEVDRTDGQRTGEGITYRFIFEHGPGVVVTPIVHALEYCASKTHQDGEVEATQRIDAPAPGRRARSKVTLCDTCWANVVVSGLDQGSYDIDID